MAVQPLFISNVAKLKTLLRMTGATASDFLAILDEGMRTARQRFYHALGESRIAELLATNSTDAPMSAAEYARELANSTEVLIVYAYLLELLPVKFLDGSANTQQSWNDEAPFRDFNEDRRTAELDRLQERIEANLNELGSDSEGLSASIVTGFLMEPEVKPDPIGASIWHKNLTWNNTPTSEII